MYLKKLLLSGFFSFVILANINFAEACTTLVIKDTEGNHYQGRTLEFTTDVPSDITYIPKGTKISSYAPVGSKPLVFSTKYAIIGMSANLSNRFILADGINEKGLTFTLNAYAQANQQPLKPTDNVLDANDLGVWMLGNFNNIEDLKASLKKQTIWLSGLKEFQNAQYPFHIAVFEPSGKGIVIEFENSELKIYDNQVNAMTNTPSFSWHLANLNNYTDLTTVGKMQVNFGDYKASAYDVGGNLKGLPVEDGSVSRFVRAAFYANNIKTPKPADAITTLGKIMNKFDRINGITTTFDSTQMSEGTSTNNKKMSEWTVWTSLMDMRNATYYIRPENSLNYYKFDFKSFEGKSQMVLIPVFGVGIK
jgi:choloylglycine hydrolase